MNEKEWLRIYFNPDYASYYQYEYPYFTNVIEFPIKTGATVDEALSATNTGIEWIRTNKFPRTGKLQWKTGLISFRKDVTYRSPDAGAFIVAVLSAIFNEFPECRVELSILHITWKDWEDHIKRFVENMPIQVTHMELGIFGVPATAHLEFFEIFDTMYYEEDMDSMFRWPKK